MPKNTSAHNINTPPSDFWYEYIIGTLDTGSAASDMQHMRSDGWSVTLHSSNIMVSLSLCIKPKSATDCFISDIVINLFAESATANDGIGR